MRVGRKRTKNFGCPPGVRELAGRWYWQPTSKREREERARSGLSITVPLGPAGAEARKAWAKLAGYDDAPAISGTVAEVLDLFKAKGLTKKPNGKPRSEKTITEYKRSIEVLRKRFGGCRYGKTEFEASRGQALGVVDVQRFIADEPRPATNRHVSCLSSAFAFAIRAGRTTYNPCAGVAKTAEEPRTREPAPWEVEALAAVADARGDLLLRLLMDFEGIAGWRISDMLRLQRHEVTAAGVRLRQGKRGKRQLWEWTPGLRRIMAEAAMLPGAKIERLDRETRAPLPRYVFATNRGEMLTLDAFEKRWAKLKARTNALLAESDVPLRIDDLHFHDVRSKAHDDAVESGEDGAAFLGNRPEVAERVYARREQKRRPLR
jgi:site-specific recombinase XerD